MTAMGIDNTGLVSNKSSQDNFDGDALKASKYLERFKRLEAAGILTLKGDMLLVEKLPKIEKKTKSGIIMAADVKSYKGTMDDDCAEFGIVLMTGPGQVFENGEIIPPDAKPGDVILLPGNVQAFAQFGHLADYVPYTIVRLRDSQVPMVFTDYKKVFEVLNGI